MIKAILLNHDGYCNAKTNVIAKQKCHIFSTDLITSGKEGFNFSL